MEIGQPVTFQPLTADLLVKLRPLMPALDVSKPAVWTALGNMNCDKLVHANELKDSPTTHTYHEVYAFHGVIVREDTHCFQKSGVSGEGAAADFGNGNQEGAIAP